MSAEENRNLIRRFYDEGWKKNDLSVYDELVNEDFLDHQALPGLEPGREGFKMLNVMFRSAFPDLRVDVDFAALYGPKWAVLGDAEPSHVTLAAGSHVAIAPAGDA